MSNTPFVTYLGTQQGVYRLDAHGLTSLGLEPQRVSAIQAWRDSAGDVSILAGSYEDGLFRSSRWRRQLGAGQRRPDSAVPALHRARSTAAGRAAVRH